MRVLNVAEKPSISKAVAGILAGGGSYQTRASGNKYIKNYDFLARYEGRDCDMVMTAVMGHLLEVDFPPAYRKWNAVAVVELFGLAVTKTVKPDMREVADNISREAQRAHVLAIWTDCDLEGENIGAEIATIAQLANPRIRVRRARFSVVQPREVQAAWNGLVDLDYRQVAAVDARSELDLRIGAAFTRLQTLQLKARFSDFRDSKVISYGSCQFPTLGFIVDRYLQVQQFISEPFWSLAVEHEGARFTWARHHLYDRHITLVLYEMCMAEPTAHVLSVNGRPTSKWAPLPLTTVEMMKASASILRLPSDRVMHIAEALYNQGIISYPRTETDVFEEAYDLQSIVRAQLLEPQWSAYAQSLLDGKFTRPRRGSHNDKAHPPIHPVRAAPNLQGEERRVYEFIARRFLACCSEAARGHQTTVIIRIGLEHFTASGLMVLERNYLDIYPYDSWKGSQLPVYEAGQTFLPTSFLMNSGTTSPPSLLTEAELIAIMDKSGIGTDATIHEHIKKIQDREYARKDGGGRFHPTELGLALVTGYDEMDIALSLSKPELRRMMECNMKKICDGSRAKDDVVQESIEMYRTAFVVAEAQCAVLEAACARFLGHAPDLAPTGAPGPLGGGGPRRVRLCPRCGVHHLALKTSANTGTTMLGCLGFPECRESVFLPPFAQRVQVVVEEPTSCPRCSRPGDPVSLLEFAFERGQVPPSFPSPYRTCLWCDEELRGLLDLRPGARVEAPIPVPAARPALALLPAPAPAPPPARREPARPPPAARQHQAPPPPHPLPPPLAMLPRSGSSTLSPSKRKRAPSTGPSSVHPAPALANPTCDCGMLAALRVSKSDKNFNRSFHSCPKPLSDATKCNFFQWQEEHEASLGGPSSGGAPPPPAPAPYGRAGADADIVLCHCGQPTKTLRSTKDNENRDRPFHVCERGQHAGGCTFFQWGAPLAARTGRSNVGAASTASPPLVCYQCGQPGHFAAQCSMASRGR